MVHNEMIDRLQRVSKSRSVIEQASMTRRKRGCRFLHAFTISRTSSKKSHASLAPSLAPSPCITFIVPPSTILMTFCALYCGLVLKMSESPASRMVIVEQRKSFPQAVPSSICITHHKSAIVFPSTARWVEAASQGSREWCSPSRAMTALSLGVAGMCSVGREAHVVAGEVVDVGLGEHAVVYPARQRKFTRLELFDTPTYTRAQTS